MQIKEERWFNKYLFPIKLFLISRIGIFLFVYICMVLFPLPNDLPEWQQVNHRDNSFLDGWSRWDAFWYRSICDHGYTNCPTSLKGEIGIDTAFYPLYPLLMRTVNLLINDSLVSGLLISNVSFFFALMILYRFLFIKYGVDIAKKSIILACVNPFSFLFSAPFTESLYLLETVAAFYLCEKKKYFYSSLCIAAASATKNQGVLILAGAGLIYLQHIDYDIRRIRANVLVFIFGLLGIGSYMLYLKIKFNNPLAFLEAQKAWNVGSVLIPGVIAIGVIISISFITIFVAYRKKLGLPYTVYSLLNIVVVILRPANMGRFFIGVFPFFVVFSYLFKKDQYFKYFLYFNIVLLGIFSFTFSHWWWPY